MNHSEASNLTESFNASANTYETRMGSVVRTVARHIAHSIELPSQAKLCDNACGTGAVTEAILKTYPDAHVDATDNSPGMIRILSESVDKLALPDHVHLEVADSVKLPFPTNTFDANVMSFGIFFTSDESEAAREIYRTLKPGGKAIVTCWKASALFQIIFDVQNIVQPTDPLQNLIVLEAWSKKETLKAAMHAGGFADVTMESLAVDLTRPTLDDLVTSCAENFKGHGRQSMVCTRESEN